MKQHKESLQFRLMIEMLDAFIEDGKDRLIVAKEDFREVQGGVRALQMVRKALTSESTRTT